MTNDEMRIIIERALHIPIAEADAAWILACVEERLRNEAAQQSVHPTLLESPRVEITSCQCPLCKGGHWSIPQSG